MLAVCLAGYWATAGEQIAVIDADAPQQHAAKWLAAGDGALKNVTVISSPKDLPGEMARQAQTHQRVLIDLIGADADVLTLAMPW